MNFQFFKPVFRKILFCGLFLMLSGGISSAQTTVFEDQFNSASWDAAKWNAYGTDRYLQRTQFGNVPFMATENATQFARFPLKTYNGDPRYSGTYLRGTEVLSNQEFVIGNGLEIEARLRGKNLPRGIVFAFVMYNERGQWPNTYLRDEIDYEYLTNFNKDQMWLNIWDDWNPVNGGPNRSTITTAPGLDRNDWHTYKIRWLPSLVEWYVDGVLVRQSTDILPADPMKIHFNIWAAASQWATAYDANLPVTATPSANQNFYLDVDYVQVRNLPNATVGSGNGLSATYYNNKDFTGPSIQRVDPQVNFEWSYEPPASQIDADTYSVRWTGQVQAQYTENYTFTARADDGVRLWVNNQLIIDEWHNGSPENYSGQINLVAGQKYDIKMEYYEDTGGAVAQLFWSNLRTPQELIPQSQLYSSNTPPPPTNTPPSIAISTPVNNRIYQSAPLFAGAARDAETGIRALSGLLYDQSRRIYWDGAAWTATAVNFPISTPNGDWVYQLPPLLDGRFTLRLAAVDTTGKASSSALVFSINNKKPPVIVINSPVNGRVYRALPAFNGTARDAETSVLQVQAMIYDATRRKFWNGSAWVTNALYFTLPGKETWSYNLPALQDGTYTARILAIDTSRNTSSMASTFRLDTSAPPSVTIVSPVNGQLYTSTPAWNGTASDAETSIAKVQGLLYDATRQKYWNGSAWTNTAVNFNLTGTANWSYVMPALQNGNYVARVLATDSTLNSTSTAVGFTIKSAASVVKTPGSDTVLSSASAKSQTITLNFTGALDNSAREISTWIVSVNGQSVVPTAVKVTNETVTLTLPVALKSGADISVSWPNLKDTGSKTISGDWTGKAE